MKYSFEPIGEIRSPYAAKYDAPRQPLVDDREHEAIIELYAGQNYEQAIEDLVGIDRIWVIAVFDQVGGWKPKVLTPRDRVKRGVFATRSPHRPNPIALTNCELLEVKGRTLRVRGIDLLDGTPVLDIKPYLPYADAFPDARVGWVGDVPDQEYAIDWDGIDLAAVPADIRDHATRVLKTDPYPHPYRRTREVDDGTFELAVKAWRISYVIEGSSVTIRAIVLQS